MRGVCLKMRIQMEQSSQGRCENIPKQKRNLGQLNLFCSYTMYGSVEMRESERERERVKDNRLVQEPGSTIFSNTE